MLEHGIEVTMWQLNRNADFGSSSSDEFPLKGTQVHIKLQRRGDLLVQAALTFSMKGGYLSKAINRRKGKLFTHCTSSVETPTQRFTLTFVFSKLTNRR